MGEKGPVILAQLPRPSSGTAGETAFGPCYGLKNSRKRKRLEIAAAVDGEALNIYEVQASRLVSSYAVPPISSFTCPPCSIYKQPSRDSPSLRHTVCAIHRPELQLQCFAETLNPSELPVIETYKRDLAEESSVIFLDFVPAPPLPGEGDPVPDIIAVHRNGTVRRLSHDLKEVRYVSTNFVASDNQSQSSLVVSAHWFSCEHAIAAVLRKRTDILKQYATLGSSFLILLYRNGRGQPSGLRLRILHLPTHLAGGRTVTHAGQLQSLVDHLIPADKEFSQDALFRFRIQASSARLSISCKNQLINYDLSSYAPQISSKFVFSEAHSSLYPLGSHQAAGSLRSNVRIYDVNHQAILAQYRLDTRLNRRTSGPSAPKAIRFITYFSKIDSLVAIRGRNLISLKAHRTATQNRNHASSQSALIDSLGCSTFASERSTNQPHTKIGRGFSKILFVPDGVEKSRWEAKKTSLNALVKDQHVKAFESAIASELRNVPAAQNPTETTMTLEFPGGARFTGYHKIYYILSKIFRVSANPSGCIEAYESDLDVAFLPPQTFKWLASNNHLAAFDIEQALSPQPPRLVLKIGAVARAIMKQDPSLSLLGDYLVGANLVNVDEIVQVIKALLGISLSSDQADSPSQQLLLESSHRTTLENKVGAGGEANSEDWEPPAASGGWSGNNCKAMKQLLEKLRGFSHSSISSAVQAHLDTDENLTLIQFLRQQLFYCGYTTSLACFATKSEDDHTLSLEIVARVLSSCIDSLGPLGFVESTVDGGVWHGLVPDLKAEISLALAGIDEATYLKGILQEMVRYGNSAGDMEGSRHDGQEKLLIGSSGDGGAVGRTFAKIVEDRGCDDGELSPMLPLSVKEEKTVSRVKRRKGGGDLVKRSGREMHYLKDRNIGQYSFELLEL